MAQKTNNYFQKLADTRPLIKKFRSKANCYIYDTYSNEIVRVNEIIYDIFGYYGTYDLDHIVYKLKHKYSNSDIKKNYVTINKARKEKNFFSEVKPDINFSINSINDIKEVLDNDLQHLILEITDRCNQRCQYCGFSGRYKRTRKHGKSDMSFEMTKKAVDFFLKRSKGNKINVDPGIGFYGGEPLLNFDLIRKTIKYTKINNKSKKYRFSLTTNGTLLNKEIIKYFIENDVAVAISLDGPKKLHDRYRIFSNGKGTFNSTMKNILYLKESCPKYFDRNILYSVVLAPPYDFKSIIDFFFKNPIFKNVKNSINLNLVDPYETTFFDDFGLEKYEQAKHKIIEKLRIKYKEDLINDKHEDLTIEKKYLIIFSIILIAEKWNL